MLEDILLMLDRDVRAELRRQHAGKGAGIRILAGVKMERVTAPSRTGAWPPKPGSEKLAADYLLAAVGHVPDTSALNLAAGVPDQCAQFHRADKDYRTNIAGDYAVGDIQWRSATAHAATAQGLAAVLATIRTGAPPAHHAVVPSCIFTSPEIGGVG